jgi:hypothetical protein
MTLVLEHLEKHFGSVHGRVGHRAVLPAPAACR